MAYRRRGFRRLDQLVIGADPNQLAAKRDILAVRTPALSAQQQAELYRLNYRRQISSLSATEEDTRQRLIAIKKGRTR